MVEEFCISKFPAGANAAGVGDRTCRTAGPN